MLYKPGAAIQKNLAEADGSRDNLPPPADAPKQYGLGIDREKAKTLLNMINNKEREKIICQLLYI